MLQLLTARTTVARAATIGLLLGLQVCARGDSAREAEFFETKIRPVLVEHCYECHSAEAGEPDGSLRLDFRQGLLEGGDTGPAITPGDPEASELILAIRYGLDSYQMPPEGKLPDRVVTDFETWVRRGAYDPRDQAATPESHQDDWSARRAHWAYGKLRVVAPPRVDSERWSASPIDRFIYARLVKEGIAPARPADRPTLLRRVYFDLIGLPPTPEEVSDFVSRDSPADYRVVVERLLADPAYGERWARHWLDVVRYSDTSGQEQDDDRPQHWRYRDYVIDAFNDDLPYDRFVLEHIAGDLLDDLRPGHRGETDVSPLGTSFYWFSDVHHLPVDPNLQRADQVDAQIDTVSKAFLGTTVACARCHDHKFDPILQDDYYALAGVLHSTVQTQASLAPRTVVDDLELARLIAGKEAELEEMRSAALVSARDRLAKKWSTPVPVTEDNLWGDEGPRLAVLRAELAELDPSSDLWCQAAGDGESTDIRLHIRGSHKKLGDPVPRGFLSVFGDQRDSGEPRRRLFNAGSGRLELAREILATPLAARVIVNRIWAHHFGRGIVATPDNFGLLGEEPSHPDLLDYLASELIDSGWSIKHIHRQILASETYRMASTHASEGVAAIAEQVDPDNRLLHRASIRRLEAEAIRDAVLAVSGDLDAARYGRGVQPYVSPNATASRPEFVPESGPRDGGARRSIYTKVRNNFLPPFLEVFDFPHPGSVVGRRESTVAPTQALTLLNDPFVHECAKSFAARAEGKSLEEAIAWMCVAAHGREPTPEEELALRALIEGAADPHQGLTDVAHVLFASSDFLFTY